MSQRWPVNFLASSKMGLVDRNSLVPSKAAGRSTHSTQAVPHERKCLVNVQIAVVAEAVEGDLIAAGEIEAEFAGTKVGAGLGPAVEDDPSVALLDLVRDFVGLHADLNGAETFLVTLLWNPGLV